LELEKSDEVWEIGPGLGAMTRTILENDVRLTAFEIDPGYCEYLGMAFGDQGLRLVEGDVMRTWKQEWDKGPVPSKVLGNLPYNAASAIIGDLLEKGCIPDTMVFMVQKEMGDRMTASCDSKDYSSFSILCQYSCDIKDAGNLNPGSFYPAPRVSSKIIVMKPRKRDVELKDRKLFLTLVRGVFLSRRKTLHNNLKRMCSQGFAGGNLEQIESLFHSRNIDTGRRPETLTVDQFVLLANDIFTLV